MFPSLSLPLSISPHSLLSFFFSLLCWHSWNLLAGLYFFGPFSHSVLHSKWTCRSCYCSALNSLAALWISAQVLRTMSMQWAHFQMAPCTPPCGQAEPQKILLCLGCEHIVSTPWRSCFLLILCLYLLLMDTNIHVLWNPLSSILHWRFSFQSVHFILFVIYIYYVYTCTSVWGWWWYMHLMPVEDTARFPGSTVTGSYHPMWTSIIFMSSIYS